MSATVDGKIIKPKSVSELDAENPGWQGKTGYAYCYYQPNPDQLMLVDLPKDSVTLTLRMAYCPTRDSTSAPSFLFEDYAEVIAAGAVSRLLSQPGQTYSDPKSAQSYANAFQAGWRDAALSTRKSFTNSNARVNLRGIT